MTRASRRTFLYWLLLLVPTLVVGGVAVQLLRREEARLAAQGMYAREAREAAAAARARLIVENVELLVGDVETGLLDTLASQPVTMSDSYLLEWERSNPLVRVGFRCTADGRLLRPRTGNDGDETGGFARRFPRVFGANPPWSASFSETPPAFDAGNQPAKEAELDARKDVTSNVAQVQSARRNVQALLKAKTSSDRGTYAASGDIAGTMDKTAERSQVSTAPAATNSAVVSEQRSRADREHKYAAAERSKQVAGRTEQLDYAQSSAEPRLPPTPAVERRGWVARQIDGRLHLIGWFQAEPQGEVRGVEADLPALVSRLAGALPVELSGNEGYALLDDQGRVVHQVGEISRTSVPVIKVPVAAALLPGWTVAAYLRAIPAESASLAGFFWLGVLLVGLFVVAILAGGSLLFRQARRSEAEAAQKTSFVANVSHEFKTPLTTIRLYAELLEQGRVRDSAKGTDYLRTIGRETQRLTRLINNVLDFSRLEQGRKKFSLESLDVVADVATLLDTHRPRLSEAGLSLETTLPREPLRIRGDRDAIEQIVLNLLDNACKYASGGGVVTVTVRSSSGGGVEVAVGDRGPGVPADQREKIFDRFHRVDDSLRAERTGTGLGLSIARQLARGMGGELRHTPRFGGGSEFILQLR